jgi:hypothetical protein
MALARVPRAIRNFGRKTRASKFQIFQHLAKADAAPAPPGRDTIAVISLSM